MNSINNILFNPISWVDSSHYKVDDKLMSQSSIEIINDIIVKNNHWTIDFINDADDAFLSWIISNWRIISRASFLVTCLEYREHIESSGVDLNISDYEKKFIMLDLYVKKSNSLFLTLNHDDLYCYSFNSMMILLKNIPIPLLERVPYLYPSYCLNQKMSNIHNEINLYLLKLAIQHIRNTPK